MSGARHSGSVRLRSRIGWGLIVLLVIVGSRPGRPSSSLQQTGPSEATARIPKTLPFSPGEKLVYQVRYSKFIISATVGKLTFTFDLSQEKPLTRHYHIRAEARSEGVLLALLGITVEDLFESFVDIETFGVVRTRKNLAEGKTRLFQLAVFDRENQRVTFVVRDLTRPDEPPKVGEKPTRDWVQDIVSATYYVRSQPLVPNTSFVFPLSDEGETFDLEVKVFPPEEVETPLGRIKALRLEPQVFGEGRLIKREGEMVVWVTEDERHVPVAARLRTGFGTVTAQLIEGYKPPLQEPSKEPDT
ncbi:MAG TPA: DUF3108 domain-containing protein [Blastocatellia bacterium]|nr:DUF3108 domain-containing protein [Blastocatellia bacterium]